MTKTILTALLLAAALPAAVGAQLPSKAVSDVSVVVTDFVGEHTRRNLFDEIRDSAPRSPFDQIADTAPNADTIFDQLRKTAP